ncbi:sigma-70 family RNA polymerase sigma factor [Actinosynnema sp. NPDC050436]|uniref:sigma-70 family RNA polymerase sigma factor n=1 Tax=Actinosynnema sp. NPDC050436 TaxID=3155659 RepID=UPI0033FFFE07
MDPGEEVVRRLYDRWRGPLHGYVLRLIGGDHEHAEEVVREALLRASQHADEVTPEDAGPWLHAVARDLVVSGLRRRGGRDSRIPVGPPPPTDEAERALQGWQVVEALRALSPAHRAVVVELYYRRRTVTEASATLVVPTGTVTSRCFYALRALRDALDERGVTS